jgi:hypothetical protein
MSQNTIHRDRDLEIPAQRPRTSSVVINWVLAVATIPAAAAVVLFAYMQVLGTAGCTDSSCPRQGPGELGFTLITYGLPALAVLTVVVSFFTARRRRGIVPPALTWILLVIGVIVLIATFP